MTHPTTWMQLGDERRHAAGSEPMADTDRPSARRMSVAAAREAWQGPSS